MPLLTYLPSRNQYAPSKYGDTITQDASAVKGQITVVRKVNLVQWEEHSYSPRQWVKSMGVAEAIRFEIKGGI